MTELSYLNNVQLLLLCGKAITIAKGHEPMLYEAIRVIAGPFFEFTPVKMKGPNKPFNQIPRNLHLGHNKK